MTGTESKLDMFIARHERAVIWLLCVLAGVRVLIFCAGYPLFSTIDEHLHFDVVYRYARGEMPARIEKIGEEPSKVMAWCTCPEYLATEECYRKGQIPPPLWTFPPGAARRAAHGLSEWFQTVPNRETAEPPLYYALAAGWYRLGEALGVSGARLVYWTRALNALILALLVAVAHAFLKRLYPGRMLPRIGVPLLVAFFPQDVFYCVNSDVLTPLVYTIAFYTLLRVGLGKDAGCRLHIAAGLSIAAALLTKLTNITILVPLAVIVGLRLSKARADGRMRAVLPRLGLMLFSAALPVGAWLARNYTLTGHLTGASEKARDLGWVHKPLAQMLDHPVFTPAGAYTFVSELIAKFWRGEVLWHRAPLASPESDAIYQVTTIVFITAGVVALVKSRSRVPAAERLAAWSGISAIVASVALLLAFSIAFDFGKCFYPSSSHPFLTSGRLALGVLIPFLTLYVTGLDYLLVAARLRFSPLGVVMLIAALAVICSVALVFPLFHSPFNLLHTPSGIPPPEVAL